jgi:hypothetical protein
MKYVAGDLDVRRQPLQYLFESDGGCASWSDDLTRENVMRQAANLKDVKLPMLLPGIVINTSTEDYAVLKESRLARFNGKRWTVIGGR